MDAPLDGNKCNNDNARFKHSVKSTPAHPKDFLDVGANSCMEMILHAPFPTIFFFLNC